MVSVFAIKIGHTFVGTIKYGFQDKVIHHQKVPNVYKEQGYDWWGVRLQANCTISSFTISNGFILEANDTMVLVSQRSDQVQDSNTDLIINPTFDSSQSDCGFRHVTLDFPWVKVHDFFIPK